MNKNKEAIETLAHIRDKLNEVYYNYYDDELKEIDKLINRLEKEVYGESILITEVKTEFDYFSEEDELWIKTSLQSETTKSPYINLGVYSKEFLDNVKKAKGKDISKFPSIDKRYNQAISIGATND